LERLIAEDTMTEYLYLLGVEEEPRSLVWHALAFSAGSKVADLLWRRIEPFQKA